MEPVESFWWANNTSWHSLLEATKSQNQAIGCPISPAACISSRYTPYLPLWSSHKSPYRSHEDFRKSTLPSIWARSQMQYPSSVVSCFACQKRNSPTKKYIHSLRAWQSSLLFTTVGTKFLGPLLLSAGNHYFPMIGDHCTNWQETVAPPDQSALTTAKALDQWISRFGCPESLQLDQGRNFEANFSQI